MPQSLANVLIHVIFSTKNRAPIIEATVQNPLYAYMASICRTVVCHAHKIGGTNDHVHLVCSLSRTTTIADLVGTIKADSSKWMKTQWESLTGFSWQNGYGAFSIGQSQLDHVKHYIAGQSEHHRMRSFQEEFREFLRRYEIQFDERYVWD
ncbi:MAG: IS200/IS605 family transposase [Pirellulales bacterium]|nr:IS200/IS605 family transposase [Pirellulales bacterium]